MKRPVCWLALLFLLLLTSMIRQRGWQANRLELENTGVILEGRVAEKSRKENSYGEYWEITIKDVKQAEEEKYSSLGGSYLVLLKPGETVLLGQWIRLKAVYSQIEEITNPGQFDSGKWYNSMGILGRFQQGEILASSSSYSVFSEKLWRIREKSFLLLTDLLGKEDGSLMAAMLLGEKQGLTKESKELYQRNGISHVLAISGLHLSLLGMGIYGGLKRLLPFPKTVAIVSAVFMVSYCIFTGSSVSTVRATLMFVLSLLATVLNRSYDCLTALAVSSLFLLLFNPYGLENSGFLLSFLAVIGVTYLSPILKELFQSKGKILSSLSVSVSASLTTLPVILQNYGTYPWYAIILNLLILPCMSLLLGMTVALIFLSEFLSELISFYPLKLLQTILVLGIRAVLRYIEICCHFFEQFPFQDGYLGSPSFWQILIYSLLLFLLFLSITKNIFLGSDTLKKILLLLLLSFLTISFRTGVEITMLDVGQGDSIVIRNSNGRVYLSDCGSSSISQVGKYRLLPFLKEQGYGRIEAVFISHLDKDHFNGITELLELMKTEKIKVNSIIFSQGAKAEEERKNLEEILLAAEKNNINVVFMKTGDHIFDDSLSFTCLHPFKEEEGNNGSLVLQMSYGRFDLLLTGDVEEKGEEEILKKIEKSKEDVEVLKVAHHGSAGSSSEPFIRKLRPKVSLISCGKNNSYGHPSKEVVDRLSSVGSLVLDTRKSGAITIYPKKDGSFRIETFLKQ